MQRFRQFSKELNASKIKPLPPSFQYFGKVLSHPDHTQRKRQLQPKRPVQPPSANLRLKYWRSAASLYETHEQQVSEKRRPNCSRKNKSLLKGLLQNKYANN